MKNYLILAMILIAGMTAYPQATRSRESKSEKGTAKKETVQRSAAKSDTKASRSASVERSKATPSKSEATRSKVETRSSERQQTTRSNNEGQRTRVETKSSGQSAATRSNNEGQRTRVETKSSGQSAATRSNNEGQRTRVETKSSGQSAATRSNNEAVRRSAGQERVQQSTTQRKAENSGAQRRQEATVTRPENRSGSERTARESGNDNDRDFKVSSSSASRIYREGRGTLTRDDGTVIRHQNDEVFASRKYKLDFDNYENLRRSDDFRREYRDYDNWCNHRYIRVVNHYHNNYVMLPWEVRRSRYYYRHPVHYDLIWTPLLFHRFMYYYPTHRNWEMEFGSQIETISAYEAQQYAGTVRRVYGKVEEVYYSPEDENYVLYVGGPFPYQDISIVIPRHIARSISGSPKWHFEDEFVWVVGLINMWEGKPEIVVRDEDQIRRY